MTVGLLRVRSIPHLKVIYTKYNFATPKTYRLKSVWIGIIQCDSGLDYGYARICRKYQVGNQTILEVAAH